MKTKYSFFLTLMALVVFSCGKHTVKDHSTALAEAVKDTSAVHFFYSAAENADQSSAALTSPTAQGLIEAAKIDKPMVLRYTAIKDKKSQQVTYYKTELTRKDNAVTLTATDITNNKMLWEKTFDDRIPDLDTILQPPASGYNSIQDCINDFNCKHRGELQCEANKTCKDQFAALTCCLTNGQCFSVHLIITPTSIRCRLLDLIPEVDGLVFERR